MNIFIQATLQTHQSHTHMHIYMCVFVCVCVCVCESVGVYVLTDADKNVDALLNTSLQQ